MHLAVHTDMLIWAINWINLQKCAWMRVNLTQNNKHSQTTTTEPQTQIEDQHIIIFIQDKHHR